MSNYLYLSVERHKQITQSLEESGGEFANEKQEKQYDKMDWSLDRNIEDGILAWKQSRANIESAKAELARMAKYKAKEEKTFNALTNLLMEAMKIRKQKSFGSGPNSMSLTKCPPSLPPTEEIDEDLIPGEYYKELPAKGPLQKSLLLKAVKLKIVTGIELITDKLRLSVKA